MGNCCCPPAKQQDVGQQQQQQNHHQPQAKPNVYVRPEPTSMLLLKIERAQREGRKVVTALFDYQAPADDVLSGNDLNLQKNDILEVLNEDGEWWLASNLVTNKKGYVPYNYVTQYDSIQQFEWYHGEIDRKEAEKRLMAPGHVNGTFLVRFSKPVDATVGYALSQLHISQPPVPLGKAGAGVAAAAATKIVRHYRVRSLPDGRCMLSPKLIEATLDKLILLYSARSDGTNKAGTEAPLLTRGCPKGKPDLVDVSRNTRDEWQIDRNVLEFNEKLGSGQFGEVCKGRWLGYEVAIKSVVAGRMDTQTFLAEATVMKHLRHENLVSLYAVCLDAEPFYIVTEFLVNGDLQGYLRRSCQPGKVKPTVKQLIDIAAQVAEGMAYIHLQGIIHRDLAARNVLVGENNHVKIGDFGLARLIDSSTETWNMSENTKLPIKWTAPEALVERKFSFKTDIWSYGVLLVELFTYGDIPYKGIPTTELLDKFTSGYRHPKPADCPTEVYDTMLYCWKRRPDERPTFDHLQDRLANLEEIDKQYQEV